MTLFRNDQEEPTGEVVYTKFKLGEQAGQKNIIFGKITQIRIHIFSDGPKVDYQLDGGWYWHAEKVLLPAAAARKSRMEQLEQELAELKKEEHEN